MAICCRFGNERRRDGSHVGWTFLSVTDFGRSSLPRRTSRHAATSDQARCKEGPRGDVERMYVPRRFALRRKSFPAERTYLNAVLSGRKDLPERSPFRQKGPTERSPFRQKVVAGLPHISDGNLGQECPRYTNRQIAIQIFDSFRVQFATRVFFKLQLIAREGCMSLLLERIRKSYREPGGTRIPVLGIERFAMNQGEQVALIGASGGGKTTLLNIISGILTPDSGRVVVDGSDIAARQEVVRDRFRAAKIGIVFQTFNLLPAFSALENVLLGMSFSGRSVDKVFAKQLLERVGLGHRLHHSPQKLSVGEQQRVAVARSLANKPVLLLADEPTANVDLANQQLILDLIRDTCRDHNVTLLMVTHSADVAGTFARVENLKDFNRPELCLQEKSA